ncbi:glutathione S-transferase N-terminal domain-containing protein [Hyphomicrobium sp.]|uniref:glutathione S-transferase N-terminal domain-containing protein n=1 Tax=Hyphomicrobium sp. TaxID=82 RepID=UPI001D93F720|nr:glutathione S-transferase N-terminal domain-containing protein [Hyphomicrobium sp.]MBY0559627.1 glutathione S-transferase N-terminal domain-containing protein [Hyphomicrobium sp.]
MILYYSPGACSLSDHIALIEAGMKFDLAKVDLKTHKVDDGRSYLDINPKGYVPALQFDDGEVLTENIAILSYIADKYPALMAPGQFGRYRLLEMLSFISSEIHKSFGPFFNPATTEKNKAKSLDAIRKRFDYAATRIKGPYIFGEHATVADAYLFVTLLWAEKIGIDVPKPLKTLAEHMRARPTVDIALRQEGLA